MCNNRMVPINDIMYRGVVINIDKRIFAGIVKYKATAQINRPDAGCWPEWEFSLDEAIDNEKIFIDNILDL